MLVISIRDAPVSVGCWILLLIKIPSAREVIYLYYVYRYFHSTTLIGILENVYWALPESDFPKLTSDSLIITTLTSCPFHNVQ